MGWLRRAVTMGAGIAMAGTASAAPDTRPSLCAPDEVAIFSCRLGTGRIVSLCASPDLGESTGTLRYLYGREGRPELVHPEPGTKPAEAFTRGIVGAGYGDFIRFRRGDTSYTLESLLPKVSPEVNRLRVTRAGKTLLSSECRDDPLGDGGFGLLYRAKLPRVEYEEE